MVTSVLINSKIWCQARHICIGELGNRGIRWWFVTDKCQSIIYINANLLLTHWGRAMQICVGNLTTIGSDHGLSPSQRQAIVWTNAGLSLAGPLETNFIEILIDVHTFWSKKMLFKVCGKWWPFCVGLIVLTYQNIVPGNVFDTDLKTCHHILGSKARSIVFYKR